MLIERGFLFVAVIEYLNWCWVLADIRADVTKRLEEGVCLSFASNIVPAR